MSNQTGTIRLIYPQWQGGIVSHWMPDIPAEDASRGYYLGAQMLNMLAPQSGQKVYEVPVSQDITDREVENGMMDRKFIIRQTRAALDILEKVSLKGLLLWAENVLSALFLLLILPKI